MLRPVPRSIAIVLILVLAASVLSAQQLPRVPGPPYAPGEIVVGFEPTVSPSTLQTLTLLHGAVTVRQFPQIRARLMRVSARGDVGRLCAELSQLKGIRYAEPNYSRRALLV